MLIILSNNILFLLQHLFSFSNEILSNLNIYKMIFTKNDFSLILPRRTFLFFVRLLIGDDHFKANRSPRLVCFDLKSKTKFSFSYREKV